MSLITTSALTKTYRAGEVDVPALRGGKAGGAQDRVLRALLLLNCAEASLIAPA